PSLRGCHHFFDEAILQFTAPHQLVGHHTVRHAEVETVDLDLHQFASFQFLRDTGPRKATDSHFVDDGPDDQGHAVTLHHDVDGRDAFEHFQRELASAVGKAVLQTPPLTGQIGRVHRLLPGQGIVGGTEDGEPLFAPPFYVQRGANGDELQQADITGHLVHLVDDLESRHHAHAEPALGILVHELATHLMQHVLTDGRAELGSERAGGRLGHTGPAAGL